ncbi:MAG: TRAP transporter substrate-binding protein DctP [Oscillospiraceae bacterium]|nr:TRAP transporter substrate-binding protein DctP [Oscillospiraceae bacterium]
MKIKKILALLLACCMVLGLAACGSAESAAPAESAAAPAESAAEAPAEAPADAEAPAADAETSAADAELPAEGEVIACDPLEITFSTVFNETETGGMLIKHFEEYLSKITDGAITMNIYWGGTVFDDFGALEGISSGAVNMTPLGHMPHVGTLNYLGFPGFAPGGTAQALAYFDELMFKNPETSALIQQEAADNGIIYLNVLAGGANAFCATFEYTDLDSLIAGSGSFGNMDAAIFEALGFQVTSVGPGDTYDALQRGLIDASQMGLAPMVSMGWQDVAGYWSVDGTYAAGNMFTANLDWWNSLTDAQREAIQAACTEVEQYSAGIYDDAIASDLKTIEDATGHKIVELSQDDIDRIWAAVFEAKAASALATAEPNGKTEGMTKILEVAAEFTGYNWEH